MPRSDFEALQRVSAKLPKNIKNPYEAYAVQFQRKRHPHVSPGIFGVMIAFTIINLITISLCVFSIVLPILTNPKRRRKYLWIVKTTYLQSHTRPSWVPNSILTVSLAQVLSTLACVIYTITDYVGLRSGVTRERFLTLWIQIVWLFEFYAAWISFWSAFYTFLSSPNHLISVPQRLRRLFNPRALNCLFIIFPAAVTMLIFAWMVELQNAGLAEKEEYDDFMRYLEIAQANWTPQHGRPPLTSPTFVRMALRKIHTYRNLVTVKRWNFYSWAMIMTVTFFLHSAAAILLLKLLRTCSNNLKGVNLLKAKIRRHKEDTDTFDSKSPSEASTLNGSNLEASMKRGHQYTLAHSILVNLASLYTSSICYALGYKSNKIINSVQWRSLSAWLYLLSGAIVTIAMFLQVWRIFTDLDVIIPTMDATETRSSWVTVPERDGSIDSENCPGFDELVLSTNVHRAEIAVRRQPVLVVRKAF